MPAATPPDESLPWDLLARCLAGEATSADVAAAAAWQAAAPENAALWRQLTGVWAEAGTAAAPAIAFGAADTAQAWQRFETTVLGPPSASGAPDSAPTVGPAQPVAPPAVPVAPPPSGGLGALGGLGKAAALLLAGAGAGWLLRSAVPPAPEASAPVPVSTTAPLSTATSAAHLASAAEVDLVFEDTPLAAVARRVEGAFPGTRVEVADPALAEQRFTGTFRAATPAAVLRVASLATGATITRRAAGGAATDSAWVLTRAPR